MKTFRLYSIKKLLRILLFLLIGGIIISAFNSYAIRSDYIVRFPDRSFSLDSKNYVTKDHPITILFIAKETDLYGVGFRYDPAEDKEAGGQYRTEISLVDQGEVRQSFTLLNTSVGVDSDDDRLLFYDGTRVESGKEYEIRITSDAENENDALSFYSAASASSDGSYTDRTTASSADEADSLGDESPDRGETYVSLYYRWLSAGFVRKVCSAAEILLFAALLLAAVLISGQRRLRLDYAANLFFISSLILGLLYAVLTPAFRVPDEDTHFVRILGILQGHFVVPADGKERIPDISLAWESYAPYLFRTDFRLADYGSGTKMWSCINMALYNPVVYLFQILGVWIGNLIRRNVYTAVLCGRFASVIGCSLMIRKAIQKIPYGKTFLALLSLTPVAIQERASLSADALTYAAVVLLLGYILSLRCRPGLPKNFEEPLHDLKKIHKNDGTLGETDRKEMPENIKTANESTESADGKQKGITGRELIILSVLLLLVSCCKVVYFVTAVLVLLLPDRLFRRKSHGVVYKLCTIAVTFGIAIGWVAFAGSYLGLTHGGGNAGEKVLYILHHPGAYFSVMNNTFWGQGADWMVQTIGSKMGYPMLYDTNITLAVLGVVILVCEFGWERGRKKERVDYRVSFVSALTFLGAFVLILTSLYVQWTTGNPSEIESIAGIWGRYFLPVIPVLYCCLCNRRAPENTPDKEAAGNEAILIHERREIGMMILIAVIFFTYLFCSSSYFYT